ncbi:LacI family DNA-binding transcriptional regulator [Microbacterium sp. NPDC056234]|uniref:LacI family DNA-binding transcriptional regulator n=1 Tax=Microbacterium sp. NPDC056234 TaxID=3345757 RepID=UPI0035E06E3B
MNEAHARTAPVSRRVRTGIVALAVPDLNEPYFAELTSLFVTKAHERGLSILIQQTAGGHEREVDIANGVGLPPIDGLVHIPRSLTVGDLTRRTAPGPIVLLGEHIQVSPFTHVTVDNKGGTDAATVHLADAGCRRIAFIGRRDALPSDAADQRFAGYRAAVDRLGLGGDAALIATVDAFTPEEGRRAMADLIARGVECDGVVCSNDSLAFGVLAALHHAGIRVPTDVAVIGFDDVHAARFSAPTLTSVAPDDGALVDAALDQLERQMNTPPGMDMPVQHVVVGARIVQRSSTAR